MTTLASTLLLLVLFTHYGPELVASFYGDGQTQAAKAWFYIARGVEGTALFGLVWLMASGMRKRYRASYTGVSIACAWGMVEEAQTSICRLATPIASTPVVGPFSGLCDAVTGFPIYAATLFGALVIASLAQESGDAPQSK